jgi:hypothetical protein
MAQLNKKGQIHMRIAIAEFPDGLTIRELKAALENWSETTACDEDCEVWISNAKTGTSSPVKSIIPLNVRRDNDGAGSVADMLLEAG